MIYIKSRKLFPSFFKTGKTVSKWIFDFLTFLNLHVILFVVVVGILLYLLGVFNTVPELVIVYPIVLVLSIIFAISSTINKIINPKSKNKKKKKNTQDKDEPKVDVKVSNDVNYNEPKVDEPLDTTKVIRYFKTAKNPNVVVVEYIDRYDLYYKSNTGFKFIRTDYKGTR